MEVLKGSCLCGKVRLEVADEFKYMGNCHCSECRKFTGSDYSSAGGIALDKLLIIQGKEDNEQLIRKVKIPSYVFVAIAAQVYIRKRITESSIFA